ncbi:flippase [Spirosoma koreense]
MRKIIANIGWIFFDKVFRMVVGVLVGVWIARYLGPAEFGILNYASLFPTIFISFAGAGLTNVLMVELSANNSSPIKQNRLVQTSLIIKLIAGILSYGLTLLCNYIFNRNNPSLFFLINIAGLSLILQSSDVIETYFQAHTKAKMSVIVKVIAFGIASIMRVYALLNHRGIIYFAAINVIELIIAYILLVSVYKFHELKLINTVFIKPDYKLISHLLNVAWPIMLSEFFIFVYMKVDQFMIESLSTNRELGLYGAALRLSEVWYFISIAINTSFYPKIADSWNSDRIRYYNEYQNLLNILVYISLFLAIFVSLFSNQLISLIYGVAFSEAGIILSVHIWAGVFVFIGVGSNNLILVENLQTFALIKTILGAVVNILLNLWLIPKLGALGASIATFISYGFSAYGMNMFYKPARHIFSLQSRSFINFVTFQLPFTRQSQFLS